ncbi:trafficking protein particle complex subunit 11-like [Gigantopelta aegis]|uniref:trafficking protein particle complex subunit 11-like n=1 Tax=Gigantopelta aegis TaxID=1735272 RepID=UPI001B88B1BC|nr:trafficking protein particle complex subunit 11-like [Gigantopelta aegis]XP_041357009.1 trafficking protein particle complex subunit 11-like [Gigantopelta aegis]XP_041357010.1 trafficking protein particle complex subunit 11-like [Gigantopelta aegis]XP_041357011.1 trafficking protein particle complex subunit 11-like [Gigantopelta aegis]XP_041357012.1 trafficking protein particle complex subunit 11-like [Gigantopelta aegis]
MSWASELPQELLCRPMGLVTLTGLDIKYNAIHKLIWDSFCNNRRPDRVPLKFQVQLGDHDYPKSKAKRTSYEWYIPKGILKKSWMSKHISLVPAVVVVFFDLDWDETMWKEKQITCASVVEVVRNTLQGRGTKVAVVLIQKNAPLPPGEDVIAAERAASLCSACDISAKSLYVLPHTDHLIGYTIRLENAFYELAQSYYHTEARKVKSHKDFLNKTTHQLLYVRHQIKIAFYNELKQDTHTALKHYKQAYGHILDLRMYDTNMLEIKVIGGFVNYKLCRLSFQHNAPLDAIAQFRKHIDFFKSKPSIIDLAFEHSAWMSKQFHVFGDLFDEAIKLGLTAIQTQHPGFYYQQAANHSISRKQLCQGLCKPSVDEPQHDMVERLAKLEYYGQRPWRQGHQSIDPPDAQKEKEGIAALQYLETQVDHSWIIIPLLSSAVAQFKKYKSPRMKRSLMVHMGEEYFHAKDYGKALMLLNKVMWDYRIERWWPLLTSILNLSLKCAYLTGKVQDYVTNSLELIGQYCQSSTDEKTRRQTNMIKVLSNDIPEPEPGLLPASVDTAPNEWLKSQKEPIIFTVEMQSLVPFVECKARFVDDTVSADSKITLEVCLRVACPLPIQFSKLSVLFNNQSYNHHCEMIDTRGMNAASEGPADSGDLYLVPGKLKVYTLTFLPLKEDVGAQIEISSVALELGSQSKCCAVLRWLGGGGDALSSPPGQQLVLGKKPILADDKVEWEEFNVSSVIRVVPRQAKLDLTVDHKAPSLLNEFYEVTITIVNKEEKTTSGVSLSIKQPDSEEASAQDQTTHLSLDTPTYGNNVVSNLTGIALGQLEPGQKVVKHVYLKCLQSGIRTLFVKVYYNVDVSVKNQPITCVCEKEEVLTITTITPFEVSIKLQSMKFEPIDAAHAEEPFLLMPEIGCTSPWPVEIKTSNIQLTDVVRTSCDRFVSQIEGIYLKKSECAAECLSLIAMACVQPSLSLGTYTVFWRRKCEDGVSDLPFVMTSFPLPTINIEHIPIYVTLELPAFGSVKTLLPLCYSIKNCTPYLQEVEVTMDASDSFMFAGNKQVHFRLLPGSDYQLWYNLFPLIAGQVGLPKLHVNMLRYPGTMDEVVQKMLPNSIFIKPIGKSLVMPA